MLLYKTFWSALLGAVLAFCVPARSGQGHILLSDGGAFEGRLIDEDGTSAKVASPWCPASIQLRPGTFRSWIRNTPTPPHEEAEFRFWFRSGDSLDGAWLGMDGDLLRVRGVWGQAFRLRAEQVLRAERLPARRTLLWDGLADPSAWFRQPTEPASAPPLGFSAGEVFNRKGFPSSLQRDLPVPDAPATLHLSLRFEEAGVQHRLFLFRNTHVADIPGALRIHFDGTHLHVHHRGEAVFLAHGRFELLDPSARRFDYRIFLDPAAGQVWVVLNGQRFGPLNWTPRTPPPDRPTHLSILHPLEQTAALETLRLHRWNGQSPTEASPPPAGARYEARFLNGDAFAMDNLSIQDGNLRTRTPEGSEVSIPLSNVARLLFLTEAGGAEPPPAVELRLAEGAARLGLNEVRFDGERLQGIHAASPDVWSIPVAWINLLRRTDVEALRPAPGTVSVRMMNGDSIDGRPLLCADGWLTLETAWSSEALRIPLRMISEIPSVPSSAPAVKTDTRIVFWNGDQLDGSLLEVQESDIRLRSPWGQILSAPRERVRELQRLSPPAEALPLEFAPTKARQGVLFFKPAVSLPRAFRVHAKLARRQGQHFQISFLDPDPKGKSIAMSITNRGPMLRMGSVMKSQKNEINLPDFPDVELWVDRDRETVVYDVNGERFGTFDLPSNTWPETVNLHAYGVGIELLDLYVTPIGEIPAAPDAETPQLHTQTGPVFAAHGLEWTLERMRWTDSDGTPRTAPGEALLRLRVPLKDQNPARLHRRDVQLRDETRSLRLTLALEQWELDHLSGSSENWREVLRIPAGFQGRMKLNPHAAAYPPSRFSEVWPDQSHRVPPHP